MSSDPLSRRKFLETITAGGIATVLTSCSPAPQQQSSSSRPAAKAPQIAAEKQKGNLYEILNREEYKGLKMQDGSELNVSALKSTLEGKNVTLSFGWSGCGQYCPKINANLAKIGGMASSPNDVVSIVVSVLPRDDGETKEARKAFLRSITKEGTRQEVITLFPPTSAKAISMQHSVNLIAQPDNPINHSPKIILFGRDGNELGRKDGIVDSQHFGRDWKKYLQQSPQQQR